MSDAAFAEAVLRDLEKLDAACLAFLDADSANPRDLQVVLETARHVDGCKAELLNHDLLSLDELAMKVLRSTPGEWAIRLREDVIGDGSGNIKQLHSRIRRRHPPLLHLTRLLPPNPLPYLLIEPIPEDEERDTTPWVKLPLNLPPVPPPSTPAELLKKVEEHRGAVIASLGKGLRGVIDDHNNAARFLRGEMPGTFLLPKLQRFWDAAWGLGVNGVPTWPGEPDNTAMALERLAVLTEWLQAQATKSDATPTPAAPPATQGDATLAAHLASHPNATEDEARAAANLRSLDALRKDPVWRAHVNRRIGAFMDANPEATVQQIADAVGYSKSTVHGSAAYQERRPARRARKAERKAEKDRQRKQKRRNVLWRIAKARVREYAENNDGEVTEKDIRCYLGQCRSEVAWVEKEWPAYLRSLKDTDWTRLLHRPPEDDEELSPEAEAAEEARQDAIARGRARASQRRQDNMGR